MTLDELKQYGLNVATNNKAIAHTTTDKHFFIYTAEDALTGVKGMKGVALMLELPEFLFNDQQSDNIRLITRCAFLIIQKATQGDYSLVQTATDTTAPIALQVISKMLNDRMKANDNGIGSPENKMKQLDLSSINIVDVGPVFDGWFGWRINFQFNSPIDLRLDETKWQNEIAWKF